MGIENLPDPVSRIDLTDMELDETAGGTSWPCVTIGITLGITLEWCSFQGTACGSCSFGTRGCC